MLDFYWPQVSPLSTPADSLPASILLLLLPHTSRVLTSLPRLAPSPLSPASLPQLAHIHLCESAQRTPQALVKLDLLQQALLVIAQR